MRLKVVPMNVTLVMSLLIVTPGPVRLVEPGLVLMMSAEEVHSKSLHSMQSLMCVI